MVRILVPTARRLAAIALLTFCPAPAGAQTPQKTTVAVESPHGWSVGGGVLATTFLGDCTDCEGAKYGHTYSVLATVGRALNPRADVSGEVMFVASKSTSSDRIRVTFALASVQFRPWSSKGFFIRAGAGMSFVHNWVLENDGTDAAFRSKAFALAYGAGWEWRLARHLGAQVIGTHHVGALGDLETSNRTVENVVGNFWNVGAMLIIR